MERAGGDPYLSCQEGGGLAKSSNTALRVMSHCVNRVSSSRDAVKMPPRTFLTALAIVLFPILDPAGAEDGDGRRYPQPETPPFWKGRVEEIEAP